MLGSVLIPTNIFRVLRFRPLGKKANKNNNMLPLQDKTCRLSSHPVSKTEPLGRCSSRPVLRAALPDVNRLAPGASHDVHRASICVLGRRTMLLGRRTMLLGAIKVVPEDVNQNSK